MRPSLPIRAACLLALSIAMGASAQNGKKLYCWTEVGRRTCSDALPPEAASRARAEINPRSGMRTAQVPRTPTEQERAVRAADAVGAARLAEISAARARRDLAMVESYGTEADLRRAYGARVGLLDDTLRASMSGVVNLHSSILQLLEQAAEHELADRPVPKVLASRIRDQHSDLLRQKRILATQQHERSTLDAELLSAVERYRLLKTPPTGSPRP